ncbi:MAG: hypothetical protein PVI57_09380, partial [Gemmatimonadota bacterium]
MTPPSPDVGRAAPSRVGPLASPVDPDAQWRVPWQPVIGEDRERLLAEVAGQVRGSLPPTTEVHRQRLACYPRHVLLRFVVPGEGPRETYAFHAPGQLYPLDWTWATIEAFDEVGLEVEGVLQAEDRLRFVLWGVSRSAGRSFVVESPERLTPADGPALEPDLAEHLASHLHTLAALPATDDDDRPRHRFRVPILYDGTLGVFDFEVPPSGPPEGVVVEDVFEPVAVPGADDRVTADRFFVLLRETSLTADAFLRRVRAGSLHQARVVEPVDLRNQVFEEPVTLSQVTFEHGVGFEGTRFEKGLTLDQCVVEGRLVLRDARVRGSLHASRLAFHRDGVHRNDPSLSRGSRFGRYRVDLDAGGLRVEGSLYLEGLRAVHVVDLSRAQVEGDLRLGGSRLGGDGAARSASGPDFLLRMDRLRVGGDLDLAYTRDPRSRLPERHPDPGSESGALALSTPRTVVRGAIQATGMDVGGEIILCGLRCEGNLDLGGLTLGADLNAGAHPPGRPLVVLADLHISGSTIGGSVLLNGARVDGQLGFHTSRVEGSVFARTPATEFGRDHPLRVRGEVDLSGTRVADIDLEGSRVGSLRMITGEIGRLRLGHGVVEVSRNDGDDGRREVRLVPFRTGSILLWDLTVGKRMAVRAHVEEGGDVRLGNVDCGGDVELWADPGVSEAPDEVLAEAETWADDAPPTPFALTTEIPGDLTCTGVRVAGRTLLANVRCGGRILLKNCEIGQDLSFGSYGPDPGAGEGRTRTECRELDLELTSCGGDVDLSGLVVAGDGSGSSLQARQLQVSGRILFARPLGPSQDRIELLADGERVEATVEGDVDLSVAEAAHLVLVGSAVGGRVNLERGRFRRLQVLEPGSMDGHNLADVQVERWDLPDAALRPFLDGSEPFDRAAYVEVERLLRNRAQDAEADRVYRAMRDRAIREARYERRGGRPRRG